MKRAQIIWSCLVVAITIAIVWLVWVKLSTYLVNDGLVVKSRNEQRRLFELTIALQDVENGARGFLLTGRTQFRANYSNAERDLDGNLDAAEREAPAIDAQEQLRKMRALISTRREMLRQSVAMAESGQRDRAAENLQSDSAVENAAAIRHNVLDLLGQADNRLQERLAKCRQSMLAMTQWVLMGVASLVASSSALVWFMWRDHLRQRRIRDELSLARDAAMAGIRARDDLLNIVSHELRTPLTPALIYVSDLEQRAEAGTDSRECLTIIRRQLELEARLIDDLLDVSRIMRGGLKITAADVLVHDLLHRVVDQFEPDLAEHQLKLTCSMNAGSDRVQGDESRLRQAFRHLISNAIKFTPDGGTVGVQSSSADGNIIITISDTGIGLTQEQLGTVFKPFWQADVSLTRRFGGLGVGLAIARSVVQLHKGSIRAESPGKDKGSAFSVTLPLSASSGDKAGG